MSKYKLSPRAIKDIANIWNFIARDNLKAADRVEEAIYQACGLIGNSPLAGQTREELTALPVRFWIVHPYSNYFIVYNPQKKPIRIVAIVHGARNLPRILT